MRLNSRYDCVYVEADSSGTFGINGMNVPSLPEGVSIEEALDADEDVERVEFCGRIWWHYVTDEDGNYYYTVSKITGL